MRRHVAFVTRCTRGLRAYSSKQRTQRLWVAEDFTHRNDVVERYFESKGKVPNTRYPRLGSEAIDVQRYLRLVKSKAAETDKVFAVGGKVSNIRALGSKLLFVDLEDGPDTIQVECSFKAISGEESQRPAWDAFRKTIHVGDHWLFDGTPKTDPNGNPTLKAQRIPILLSPRFHKLPEEITDSNTLTAFPQLSLMINDKRKKLLAFRHSLVQRLRSKLEEQGCIAVSTPILAGTTGGATATPFTTSAKFIADSQLKLRIATELELKMLVAAGVPRVYDLGPVFRNEGIDASHNPEFTICEFYMAYWNLDALVGFTEELLVDLRAVSEAHFGPKESGMEWKRPFPVIEFIPTLEREIQQVVPEFTFPQTLSSHVPPELLDVCQKCEIEVGDGSNTAHVLDLLAGRFIEPLTKSHPTFISHHPSITSPLAKSFVDPVTGHEVAARMELFINETECANFYEEENDPAVQAKKFLRQELVREGREDIDLESLSHSQVFELLSPAQRYYVRVLEMGMPPTGGWGAGIDRLVMLLGGADRISDVLPFGNLRHVMAMGD
jgi:lysyl-tRNA synthetase class 2